MAKFIEYKSDPWWTVLCVLSGAVVIPFLAVTLFTQGVISTIGFVVIVACGVGGLFFVKDQVERRTRNVIEVSCGKLPMRPSKAVDHTVLEFGEDAARRTIPLLVSILLVLLLLGSFITTYGTKEAWAAGGLVLAVSPAVLLLGVFWASAMRLRIEGDEVQVIYPFLGGWGNRTLRFGEITSVEVRVRNTGRGRKEVRIELQDGSSVRYWTWDESKAYELVGALKRGVAWGKPAKVDLSELA